MKTPVRIRRRLLASFVRSSGTVILVISAACVCSADIMPVDLFVPGDQLLTRDTASGLDWLDLTQGLDLSFEDIASGVGGWKELGFSHATNSQIRDLFLQIEPLAPEPFDGVAKQDLASRDLATQVNELLGPTGIDENEQFTVGLSGSFVEANQVAAPFVTVLDVTDPDGEVVNNIFGTTPRATDTSGSDIGHWLIRPVPEPSFALLRGASLATLAALSVRRRRRSGRPSSRSEESAANVT